ncbi:TIGR04086 family membrane protein [Youxingia wuxianensis]|uniref:TIGR04086 family membrane protein n=1 Tax=Youxingia wuxianensis TaxID=2763678 RepID=A0A926IH51_9FIRM|nr:TIGR04086 family membrane protein [Youxingia wuxianensis]MBC8584353.1 TIGR04086 family membrane protein [Youxingia wuxianensis]
MKQPDVHGAKRFIRPITYGIIAGAIACFLLLIIMSVIMGFKDMPQAVVSVVSLITFIFGGFTAGFVSAAYSREKGLLLGLVCGGCLFCILSLANLAFDGSGFGIIALSKLAAVLFASALGGVVGVNKRKKFK